MGWEIDGVTLEQREVVQPPPPLGEAAAAAGLIDDLQSPGSKKRHLLICKLFFPQVPSLKPNGVGIDRRSSRVWSFCGPRSLLLPGRFVIGVEDIGVAAGSRQLVRSFGTNPPKVSTSK